MTETKDGILDIVAFELPASIARDLMAICNQENDTPESYAFDCLKRDIASRRASGWNVRDGWNGREKLEAKRAASFKKTPPRKK